MTELVLLRGITVQAIEMALGGEAGDGYVHLARGRHRASGLRDGGAVWGDELVCRYTRALNEFAGLYRIARE